MVVNFAVETDPDAAALHRLMGTGMHVGDPESPLGEEKVLPLNDPAMVAPAMGETFERRARFLGRIAADDAENAAHAKPFFSQLYAIIT
jgi:hypothetical protein